MDDHLRLAVGQRPVDPIFRPQVVGGTEGDEDVGRAAGLEPCDDRPAEEPPAAGHYHPSTK